MLSTFSPYFENNPTLKLLRGNYAGFILGFFHDSFKETGQTQIPEEDLETLLAQHLQEVRRQDAETTMTRDARIYLNLWCEDGYRLLQKRFSEEKSSYVYQLTQHSEKALAWIDDLRRGSKRGYTTSDSRFGRIVTELRRIDRDTLKHLISEAKPSGNDLYGDLHYSGQRVRPVKAFDAEGRVLYCGSFSKCLSPGLRIGWIAAGRYSERVRRLKFISTVNTPIINQLAVSRYLEGGAMDRHLRRLRSALETQVAQVAEYVLQAFPEGTAISQPKGGFFLWVQLPEGVDALDLFHLADADGSHIAPGQIFCPYASIRNRIRLSCGHPCDDQIRLGIERLGELVRKLQKKGLRTR